MQDGPVAYWRLGEPAGASEVVSAVAGGPVGTVSGPVTLGVLGALPGDPDTAAHFDGSSGEVILGDHFDFAGTSAFTVEAWVFPMYLDGMNRRILNKEPSGGGDGWDFSIASNDILRVERYVSGQEDSASRAAPPLNTWTHVVGTFDGIELCIYANGGTPNCATSPLVIPNTPASLTMGNRDSDDRHFWGRLDEVAIYDYALSATRVQAHYDAAQP
jgi:hypothetical protein